MWLSEDHNLFSLSNSQLILPKQFTTAQSNSLHIEELYWPVESLRRNSTTTTLWEFCPLSQVNQYKYSSRLVLSLEVLPHFSGQSVQTFKQNCSIIGSSAPFFRSISTNIQAQLFYHWKFYPLPQVNQLKHSSRIILSFLHSDCTGQNNALNIQTGTIPEFSSTVYCIN